MSKNDPSKADTNNPNNDAYWQSKGHEKRPSNWRRLLAGGGGSMPPTRRHLPDDGRGGIDSMFDPLCKEDY